MLFYNHSFLYKIFNTLIYVLINLTKLTILQLTFLYLINSKHIVL